MFISKMAVKPLSNQQMKKYAALWDRFDRKPFEFKEAKKILNLTETHLLVTLHRLKQRGWLETKQHKENPKKSLYFLVSPNDVIKAMAK